MSQNYTVKTNENTGNTTITIDGEEKLLVEIECFDEYFQEAPSHLAVPFSEALVDVLSIGTKHAEALQEATGGYAEVALREQGGMIYLDYDEDNDSYNENDTVRLRFPEIVIDSSKTFVVRAVPKHIGCSATLESDLICCSTIVDEWNARQHMA